MRARISKLSVDLGTRNAVRPTEQRLFVEGRVVAGDCAVEMPVRVTVPAHVVVQRLTEV